ncbi:MAG TPA: dihydroorotate dehydrogenase-like protein [Chloroflexia bacterium]|nr:dihydroorotate dehydrogenase-like protein [Chloroflexia bacterium]
MADLSTTYLGLELKSPLVASASPLSEELGKIRRLEDAGASAIVMYSLFEEQLTQARGAQDNEARQPLYQIDNGQAVADYFPPPAQYPTSPEAYLEHLHAAREAVAIPVIGSLNCASIGGWTEYARQIQQAGADALELNIYHVPTDINVTGAQVERTMIEIVEQVRAEVTIPLAVKLSPYLSNVANIAWRLEHAGADGLVLFNRFYQPDINLESMSVSPRIVLSSQSTMRLPMRWIAILYGKVHLDMAASGGIHEGHDVAKMLLAGAGVTMLCSVLLRRGIEYLTSLEQDLRRWMDEHTFDSVLDMQGKLSQQNVVDPEAFERAHYIRSLHSYHKVSPWTKTPSE